jgi:tagatose 6-phosphate kinase
MILTVALNPALDVTYAVDRLRPGRIHRVRSVAERAGGKGLNVARVLHAVGATVVATGLAGGSTGDRVRHLLDADGVPHELTEIGGETRRTVVIADDAGATGLWEPGPVVSAAEWRTFLTRYEALLADAEVVVLSGSLPPGVPEDGYRTLVVTARAVGAVSVLDADGAAMRHGLAGGPDLVKPNAAELARLLERAEPASADGTGTALAEVLADARAAIDLGAREVVVSLGAEGLVAVTAQGSWRARLRRPVTGNATGAGDACVAALARGFVDARSWPDRLRDAVALSAAAVAHPTAGAVDPETVARLLPHIIVEEI